MPCSIPPRQRVAASPILRLLLRLFFFVAVSTAFPNLGFAQREAADDDLIVIVKKSINVKTTEHAAVRKILADGYQKSDDPNVKPADKLREARRKSSAEGRKLRDKYRDESAAFRDAVVKSLFRTEFEFDGKTFAGKPSMGIFTQSKQQVTYKAEGIRAVVVLEFAKHNLDEEIGNNPEKTLEKYPQLNATSHQLLFVVNGTVVDVRIQGDPFDLSAFVQKAVDIERLGGMKLK